MTRFSNLAAPSAASPVGMDRKPYALGAFPSRALPESDLVFGWGGVFILFRKHFFLFKEESEVCGLGSMLRPPMQACGGRGLAARQRRADPLSAVPGLR